MSFEGHSDVVTDALFYKEGKEIISCSTDKTIRIWDINSENNTRTIESVSDRFEKVDFSPDNKTIAAICKGSYVNTWNIDNGSIMKLKGHKFEIKDFDFYPLKEDLKKNYFITCSSDKTIKLWDLKTGAKIGDFIGHKSFIETIRFSHDGKRAISGSRDKTIKFWDIESNKQVREFKENKGWVTSLDINKQGDLLLATDRGNVNLWHLDSGVIIKQFPAHKYSTDYIEFSPDCKYFISCSNDKTWKIYDIEKRNEVLSFQNSDYCVRNASFSPDGNFIIAGSDNNTIKMWDIKNGNIIKQFQEHTGKINSVNHNTDGTQIISSAADGTIKIWDVRTGDLLATIISFIQTSDYIIYTPKGKFDGTPKGMEHLYYIDGLEIIPLSKFLKENYTPNLLKYILN